MSVFDNEWRACLREQYKHTIRQGNPKNIESLRAVMTNDLGFGEDELRELAIIATMHVDDVSDDFVPDFEALATLTQEMPTIPTETPIFQPHPLECQCPACISMVMTPHDEQGQPITDPEAIAEDKARKAKDAPKQLSLF